MVDFNVRPLVRSSLRLLGSRTVLASEVVQVSDGFHLFSVLGSREILLFFHDRSLGCGSHHYWLVLFWNLGWCWMRLDDRRLYVQDYVAVFDI